MELFVFRETSYTSEELMAMVLEKAKISAEKFAGELIMKYTYNGIKNFILGVHIMVVAWRIMSVANPEVALNAWASVVAVVFTEQTINEAVITVPPYYNQAQRRALIRAADLAGIKVLQLMNDNTAGNHLCTNYTVNDFMYFSQCLLVLVNPFWKQKILFFVYNTQVVISNNKTKERTVHSRFYTMFRIHGAIPWYNWFMKYVFLDGRLLYYRVQELTLA